ncbi:MAG: PQQ-binding-like beta-propeller repeat protein [Sedimentisphaerales bacterium]|nr:PQQ-binding-like beta-propeller repeat protein [Sedimentisphaerales bacterium]
MFQRRLGYVVLFCVVFFSIQNVQAENWFQFRGPNGWGISDVKNLPVTWSETENVAWKTAMPGYGASSPIALDGKLYVTCYSGYGMGRNQGRMEDLTLHVVCVDSQTGTILWDKHFKPILPESKKVRDHGYAAQTPTTDGEYIYVFFGKTGVFKLDQNGNTIWQTSVGTDLHSWGSGTSPILYKDLLIVNASVESQTLVALDRQTGQVKWRVGNINQSWNTPIITTSESGRRELVLAIKGKVLGFEPDTGHSLWSSDTDIRWYMTPSLVAAKGVVYSLGGRSGTAALAVRTGGSGDVTATHRLWTSTKGSNVSSPVIQNGYLYWMHEQRGIAFCAKAATGEIVYEERLPGARQVYASALLADGRLYYLDRTGKTFVLAAKPTFEQLACNSLDDHSTFNASPIVCDGALILRSDENMYCIKK